MISSGAVDIKLDKIRVDLPGQVAPLFRIQNLQIPFGTKILIQGASGKGKTTLLHLIAGLFLPSEGSVFWGPEKISVLDDSERCRLRRSHVGLVFQKLNLLEHLTAIENVMLALSGVTDAEKKARKALAAVNLTGREDALSAILSLGEQQRVAVARVLAASPSIILADEPTSSLDEVNAEQIMKAFLKAADQRTLIVVSHDHRIRHLFDRVLDFEELIQK